MIPLSFRIIPKITVAVESMLNKMPVINNLFNRRLFKGGNALTSVVAIFLNVTIADPRARLVRPAGTDIVFT